MLRSPAWLFAVVSALSGSAYLLIGLAVDGFPPTVVACVRCGVGAALVLPVAWRRGALRGLRERLGALVILGALEFAVPFTLVGAGSQWIASSLVGVLMAAGPLLVVLLAARLGVAEAITRLQLAGLLVGMAGVVCLLGLSVPAQPSALLGAALVIGASASFALGALHLRHRLADVAPLGVLGGGLGTGALLLVPAALLAAPSIDARPAPSAWIALGVLGVTHAAVNYGLFFRLVALLGAARASVTSYVAPAVAVLLGVVVLGEPAGAGLVAGLLLVLTGSWLGTGGRLPPAALAWRPWPASSSPTATEAPRSSRWRSARSLRPARAR